MKMGTLKRKNVFFGLQYKVQTRQSNKGNVKKGGKVGLAG